MSTTPDLDNLADQLATALLRRLAPTLTDQLRRHQERLARAWLTPPIAARLVGCNDSILYAALRSGELPATSTSSPAAAGARGSSAGSTSMPGRISCAAACSRMLGAILCRERDSDCWFRTIRDMAATGAIRKF